MMATFNANRFKREAEAAMRKAESQFKRDVDRVNRENQRRVDAYNRQVVQNNKRVIDNYNRQVQQTNNHNQQVVAALQSDLRRARQSQRVHYTPAERSLAERVQNSVPERDDREWDVFLSYARIDGAEVAGILKTELENRGLRVWFDQLTIVPGKSQSLQMDQGLARARAGVVVLTAAYLTGRFWTERELGALLHKSTLIPVLDRVTFDDVAQYSGILPDLAGFETSRDDIATIAGKIAETLNPEGDLHE
jgi:hypothetical protein